MSRKHAFSKSHRESKDSHRLQEDFPDFRDYIWPFPFPDLDPASDYYRWPWSDAYPVYPSQMPDAMPSSHACRGSRAGNGEGSQLSKVTGTTSDVRPDVVLGLALQGLHKALCGALALFQGYDSFFESKIQQVTGWARDGALDELWRNMVDDRFRDKDAPEKFADAGEKISTSLEAVRRAVRGQHVTKTDKQRYNLERRMRAAHKAVVHCESIVELAGRAKCERMACKFLVEEIEDAVAILDPKTHPKLYDDDYEVKGKGRSRGGWKDKENEFAFPGDSAAELPQDDVPNEN